VTWDVHFSPNGGCTAAAVALINSASTNIRVQAYSFTSQAITDALILAKTKKRDVEAIFDSSDETGNGTKTPLITAANILTWYDDRHAIAHNKVIIVNFMKVMTGSFNFTEAAESRNAENCIILTGAQLAKVYVDNWELHKAHSILTTPTINIDVKP
jgi:phosphatidylserine/phosphatidylglycerophosphate/cardiolipin synthase-like enzyme